MVFNLTFPSSWSSSLSSNRSACQSALIANDRLRLVLPPALFIILAYPWYRFAHLLFPYYFALAIFSGGVAGYIFYDMTHYFLHHRKYVLLVNPRLIVSSLPSYWRQLKRYHLAHHYKNFELGYGVTSKFWDTVFGENRFCNRG